MMRQLAIFSGPTAGADISSCGEYRYSLWRTWDVALPVLVWCLLNPSVADADEDDPTVRRLVGYSKAWGYGGFDLVNPAALRATDPRKLSRHPDPVGPRNLDTISGAVFGRTVVCAWGDGIERLPSVAVAQTFERLSEARTLLCLGLTAKGNPRHPLYLPKGAKRVPFQLEVAA